MGLDAESGLSWIPAWNYLSCSAHWSGRGLGSQGEPPVLPLVPEQPLIKKDSPGKVPHFVYGAPPNIDFVKPEKIFLLQKTQITGILNKDKKMWNPA